MLSTEVMIKLTFLVSVAAILDMLNLLINRWKYISGKWPRSIYNVFLYLQKLFYLCSYHA